MDYSIFNAQNFNMEGIEAGLISYNVMCQWSVHMMERVNGNNYLKLPNYLELRLVIGLFHIWCVHMMERVNGSNYLKLPDNLELRLVIGTTILV
jgi:hypothetical protein